MFLVVFLHHLKGKLGFKIARSQWDDQQVKSKEMAGQGLSIRSFRPFVLTRELLFSLQSVAETMTSFWSLRWKFGEVLGVVFRIARLQVELQQAVGNAVTACSSGL